MPRTKYSRKSKQVNQSQEEYEMMMKSFERHVQLRIAKLERETQADIKSFETFIDVTVSRLPMEIRRMTLGEILSEQSDDQKENYEDSPTESMLPPSAPRLKTVTKSRKRVTGASDDGYATERGSVGSSSHVTKAQSQASTRRTRSTTRKQTQAFTTRKTRSSSRTNNAKLSEINQKTITKPRGKERLNESTLKLDNFKTPALLKHISNTYNVVTPKIKPNTPLNVLRRPRQGEMALSMQGSPLLVSAVIEERTANINVPLANGNVMSLLPQEGLRVSHIPALDPETMHQLETLKKHIEKVIALK